LLFPFAFLCASSLCSAQSIDTSAAQSAQAAEAAQQDAADEWQMIAPHLPDLKTATAERLQTAGDVLRARRFPEEAVKYYQAAIERGGDQANLLNRIGVTELDRGQPIAARLYFRQVTQMRKRYAEAWNNLGATENMTGNYAAAVADYGKAVKLNRKNAMFHANLGTAYFALSDYESGRHEYEVAVKLDPNVFHQGGRGGTLVHVLTSTDRGRFAFEMARLAAGHGDEEEMLHWLAVSAETGFAINEYIKGAKEFTAYAKDERIKLILQNVKAMRAKQVATAGPAPILPAVTPPKTRD
jgi:tetratricopeptide (TPR) repeat protein